MRNKELANKNQLAIPKTWTHFTYSNYAQEIFSSCNFAGEFLGHGGVRADAYAFHLDVIEIIENRVKANQEDFKQIFDSLENRHYGDIRLLYNRQAEDAFEAKSEVDLHVISQDHKGILAAMPCTEITGVIIKNIEAELEEHDKTLVKIAARLHDIAKGEIKRASLFQRMDNPTVAFSIIRHVKFLNLEDRKLILKLIQYDELYGDLLKTGETDPIRARLQIEKIFPKKREQKMLLSLYKADVMAIGNDYYVEWEVEQKLKDLNLEIGEIKTLLEKLQPHSMKEQLL